MFGTGIEGPPGVTIPLLLPEPDPSQLPELPDPLELLAELLPPELLAEPLLLELLAEPAPLLPEPLPEWPPIESACASEADSPLSVASPGAPPSGPKGSSPANSPAAVSVVASIPGAKT
jgi:hypothetical protein